MISSNLSGGLGNQLFQIAAGFSHAKKINSNFFLFNSIKNYDDDYFNFVKKTVSNEYAKKIVFPWKKYSKTIFAKIPICTSKKLKVFQQQGFRYKSLPDKDNIILHGFFQSEKFFKNFEKDIKDLFIFNKKIKDRNSQNFKKSSKKKVAVHFRRYKYNHNILPPIPWVYYEYALKKFNTKDYEFVIFGDDLSEVRKNINTEKFKFFNNKTDVDDLYCISQCDSVIMSNSTFSWWGAWLGKKKEKVIVPPFWFGRAGPNDLQDLIPNEWEILI